MGLLWDVKSEIQLASNQHYYLESQIIEKFKKNKKKLDKKRIKKDIDLEIKISQHKLTRVS